jgi:hypothetical protein
MIPKILQLAGLCWLGGMPLAAFAAPEVIVCPTSIARTSIQVTASEQAWMPFVSAPLYLHAAAPMNGPPERRGDLTDFTTHPGKLEWSYTYKLDGAFDAGKWIQCAYGANNEITLSKRIADEAQECTITYRKGKKAAQHEIKIQCR